jgi:pimeloyl-ACP methyl ester carboxylesterase
MKRIFGLLCFLLLGSFFSVSAEEIIDFGPFQRVHVYPAVTPVTNFILIVSGDGGWTGTVVKIAGILPKENTFVVGVEIKPYLKVLENQRTVCANPARDLEELTKFVEERYSFEKYIRPMLMGYSSGATLVYASLVEATPDTFSGAMSFGFCPDLSLKKSFCDGYDLQSAQGSNRNQVIFLPSKNLRNPWIVFQGMADEVCKEDITLNFVKQIPHASFVLLPKVGHGFRSLKNWFPLFQQKYQEQNS